MVSASTIKYLSQPESEQLPIEPDYFEWHLSVELGEFISKELSVWLVTDLGTEQGRQMVLDAIQYLVSNAIVYVWKLM